MALFRGIQEYIALDANNITLVFDSGNIVTISGNIFLYPPQGHPILYNYYPYRAFGGQNEIVYSTRFVRRAIFFEYCPGNIFLILPVLYVTNHLKLVYDYDMS